MKLSIQAILWLAATAAIVVLAGAWRAARRDSANLAATMAAQDATIKQAATREKQRNAQLAAALAQIDAQKRSVRTPRQAERELLNVLPPLPLPVVLGTPISPLLPMPQQDRSSSQSSEVLSVSDSTPPATSAATIQGEDPGGLSPGPSNPPNNISSPVNLQQPGSIGLPDPAIQPAAPTKPGPAAIETRAVAPANPVSIATTPNATGAATGPPTPKGKPPEPYTQLLIPQLDLIPLYDALQDCRASTLQSEALKLDLEDEKTQSAAKTQERNSAIAAVKGGTFFHNLKQAAKWFALGAAAATLILTTTRRAN